MRVKIQKGLVKRMSADYQTVEFSTTLTTQVEEDELEVESAKLQRQVESLVERDVEESCKTDPFIRKIVKKVLS